MKWETGGNQKLKMQWHGDRQGGSVRTLPALGWQNGTNIDLIDGSS
jgi:hypothetical protein